MKRPVHVMVAILRDRDGRVLITSRPPGKVQAGRWEFPGGKVEDCEAPEACLRRELLEELGIVAGPMSRLITVQHDYVDLSVKLDVREVEHFGGEPRPRERQQLKWVRPDELPDEDILEADRPIIQALRLPDVCLVTPDPLGLSRKQFLQGLDASLEAGVQLVQLRSSRPEGADHVAVAREALEVCRRHGARLLLNGPAELLTQVPAHGIHMNSRRLTAASRRLVSADTWLSAACHSTTQLEQAERLGVDFALVSPVAVTPSHPSAPPLSWTGLAALTKAAGMPVYALGGVTHEDLARARNAGARGVAGIRAFWKGKLPG